MAKKPDTRKKTRSSRREWNNAHWNETLAKVFARASHDETFRRQCLQQPRSAIRAVDPDLDLPADLVVAFIESRRNALIIRLPYSAGAGPTPTALDAEEHRECTQGGGPPNLRAGSETRECTQGGGPPLADADFGTRECTQGGGSPQAPRECTQGGGPPQAKASRATRECTQGGGPPLADADFGTRECTQGGGPPQAKARRATRECTQGGGPPN